ncbi:MAG: M20 family metallopeptidase [Leptotrichiaceae bacterium]|nr:M20 family metallopeptidase [Leptotrichiaceae bacterium]
MENLFNVFEKNKSEYLNFLQEFIRIDTQTIGHGIKGGNEINGQIYLENLFKELGASEIIKEPLEDSLLEIALKNHNEGNLGHNNENRYNLTAKFNGKKDRTLIFNGHVDTMPFGNIEDWKYDPFKGEVVNELIYGLGSTDMKGGLMAAIMAVKLFRDTGTELPCNVVINAVADEEGGGNGSIVSAVNGIKGDAVIVCEPSDNRILTAHMGFVFFKVRVKGIALHSAEKWKGVNAIEKAICLINEINELEKKWILTYKHPLLPPPTINVGVIKGGSAGSTVPDYCEFDVCIHYIPGKMSFEQVTEEFRNRIIERSQGDEFLKNNMPEMEIYQMGNGFEIDSENEFVKYVKEISSIYDKNIEIAGGTAGNDARIFSNIAKLPTVILGPGLLKDCHTVNEKLDIEEYYKYIITYANIILKF